jgi:hypothetical protein
MGGLNNSMGGSFNNSVHLSVMGDNLAVNTMGGRESHRNSKASHMSQRSIITNPPEKPVSIGGSKAAKG